MSIRRVVPTLATDCPDESRTFYVDLLGFEVAMDMDWIITLRSPSNETAQISLAPTPTTSANTDRRGDAPPARISLTVEVEDIDLIHARALARSVPIVYPLTLEPWGVRRFAVTDPNGVVVNVMSHVT